MCRLISEKVVTTRKTHQCFGCEQVYLKGVRLRAKRSCGDGRIYTLYLCDRCHDASKRFPYGGVYYQGDLKEL